PENQKDSKHPTVVTPPAYDTFPPLPVPKLGSQANRLAGYYVSSEDTQHVIVAQNNGTVTELWWQGPGAVQSGTLATFGGQVVGLGGYYVSSEDTQHVVVALSNGTVKELWWRGPGGVNQGDLSTFHQSIVGVAGYYQNTDATQHVVVALSS